MGTWSLLGTFSGNRCASPGNDPRNVVLADLDTTRDALSFEPTYESVGGGIDF